MPERRIITDHWSMNGTLYGSEWTKRDTSAAGAPTIAGASLGGQVLTLAADDEAEILGLDFGDALAYDIDSLVRFSFEAKLAATPGTNVRICMGMASAYNATMDSVTANAWFLLLAGSAAVLVETDDGTNDNDDKATGQTLLTAFKKFQIDFDERSLTKVPPSVSVGGKGNVIFRMEDSNGFLRPVASSTLFDMSNYSVGLQPYFQMQKSSGTAATALTIRNVEVTYKQN